MSTVTRSFNLDELYIDKVYENYDQPCLFTAKNNSGQIFFVVFIDQTDSSSTWLYAPISLARLNAVKANEIDLKSVFSQTEDNFVYKVKIHRSNSNAEIEEVPCQDLTDDQLPIAGEFLDHSSSLTTNKFLLVQEIKSKGARGRNLSGADLSGADLSGADLSDADLSDADLSDADLSGAILASTFLIGANLKSANLKNANLTGAILTGAILTGAILTGAILTGATLSCANLSGVNLRSVNLSGANLRSANLRSANLSGAIIDAQTILNSKWHLAWEIVNQGARGRDLIGIDLSGADLRSADLRTAKLRGANLSGSKLRGANLSGADLSDAVVENAQFGANLGLTEGVQLDLKQRGAIFEDSPVDDFPVAVVSPENLPSLHLQGKLSSSNVPNMSDQHLSSSSRKQSKVVQAAERKRLGYRNAAIANQGAYFISEIAAVTLLSLTPILALNQKPIWAAISSSSGLIAGLSTKYEWRKNWILCQKTSRAIEQQITLFELQQDREDAEIRLVQDIYGIESNHTKSWERLISAEEPIDAEEELINT